MCTLTFVPLYHTVNDFVFTSNRDEAIERETLLPEVYTENGIKLLYPKDAVAGGTWIGISEKKRAVCLMNGGFEKHLRKPPYPKSRGVVVKDLLTAEEFLEEFEENDLKQTEPFTCIVVQWAKELELFQLVWDGKQKHSEKLPLQSYIWASTFLYSPEIRSRRGRKFDSFKEGKELTPKDILSFHSSEEDGANDGLIIDKGSLKTCSITQVLKTSEGVKMIYKDLLKEGNPVFETSADF